MWDYHVVLALKPHSRNRSSDLHGPAAATNGPGDASSPESSSLTMVKRNEDRDREDQAQSAWVYDFDSRSPTPCKWKGKSSQELYVESRTDLLTSCARHALCVTCRAEYIAMTFPYAFSPPESELTVPKEYRRCEHHSLYHIVLQAQKSSSS